MPMPADTDRHVPLDDSPLSEAEAILVTLGCVGLLYLAGLVMALT